MTELYELRHQLAQQNRINQDLNERLLAAETELKAAQRHREAMVESQKQSQLEAQAIAELQGRCKPNLERQLLTLLKGDNLITEDNGRLVLKTENEWHPSALISERIDDVLVNRYPHFRQEQPEPAGSDRTPPSYENLKSTKEILKACSELDILHREQRQERYQAQLNAAREVSEQFQQSVPISTKTLSSQQLRRRLFEEQKGLA